MSPMRSTSRLRARRATIADAVVASYIHSLAHRTTGRRPRRGPDCAGPGAPVRPAAGRSLTSAAPGLTMPASSR